MKIDFSRGITELNGNPFEEYATLKAVATVALITNHPSDANLDPMVKFKRGRLAVKIYAATEALEITTEEATELKALIGRAFGPLIVVQAFDIIEGARPE